MRKKFLTYFFTDIIYTFIIFTFDRPLILIFIFHIILLFILLTLLFIFIFHIVYFLFNILVGMFALPNWIISNWMWQRLGRNLFCVGDTKSNFRLREWKRWWWNNRKRNFRNCRQIFWTCAFRSRCQRHYRSIWKYFNTTKRLRRQELCCCSVSWAFMFNTEKYVSCLIFPYLTLQYLFFVSFSSSYIHFASSVPQC